MTKSRAVVGIDVGTAKIATLIASVQPDAPLHIIGVSTIPSRGIRKGQIVDIEETTASILQSLEASERMAGYQVSHAYVSVGGSHISSQNSHGVVAVSEPNREISISDVKRVIDAAKAVSLPSSREVIHVLPRGFAVDGQDGIKDPIGMSGVRLEVDTHIVTGGVTAVRNLEKCLMEVGVDVSGFVFGGLASASAVLTETEKELGVVLVDIGGGTIDICLFIDGALSYSSVLPIGAKNITNDLAIGLRISLESAEKIKLFLSRDKSGESLHSGHPEQDRKKEKKNDDNEIDLSGLSLPEQLSKVSQRTLIEGIIKPRLNEIFAMVGLEIKKSGFGGMTPSGVVVTGGGAETVGLLEAARRNLAMPVRVGLPANLTGLVDEVISPAFAASCGLLQYGSRQEPGEVRNFQVTRIAEAARKIPIGNLFKKAVGVIRSFLP